MTFTFLKRAFFGSIMTVSNSLPDITDTFVCDSLSLRALGLLGFALATEENGVVSAATLRTSEEFLLARQHEDAWLNGFLAESAWHFTRFHIDAEAEAIYSPRQLAQYKTPPAFLWRWHSKGQWVLRVNRARAEVTNEAIAWQLDASDGAVLLGAERALLDCHLRVAFPKIPEDAKACATYGFAAHLALPLTGSRTLHDTLNREHTKRAHQLRRLTNGKSGHRVSLQPGAYLGAFRGSRSGS